MTERTVREVLAEYAHEAWSGWMRYQKEKAPQAWGVLPTWARERWERQMSTPYVELPESEKDSDRAEADKMIGLLIAALLGEIIGIEAYTKAVEPEPKGKSHG